MVLKDPHQESDFFLLGGGAPKKSHSYVFVFFHKTCLDTYKLWIFVQECSGGQKIDNESSARPNGSKQP